MVYVYVCVSTYLSIYLSVRLCAYLPIFAKCVRMNVCMYQYSCMSACVSMSASGVRMRV